jgi:DNA-binding NtrC family response regulator
VNPVRADHKVLVIASDPLLAALVGGFVEMTRLQAAFVQRDERAEDALERIRPLAAILVDALINEAESDLFLARARRRRIPVLMFGSAHSIGQRDSWASARKVPTFSLPGDLDVLQAELERLLQPRPLTQGASERRARTERRDDGTLILEDVEGTRWSVYDRRATDRRSNVVDRQFVSESGEVRQCDVPIEDAESLSAAALTRQLARSTLVS